MLKTVTSTTAAFAALALSFGTAQAGDIQDDIANCRDAIEEAELLGTEEFRLEFVDDKGNRNRVLTLNAILIGQDDVTVECRMSRSKVKEVVVA